MFALRERHADSQNGVCVPGLGADESPEGRNPRQIYVVFDFMQRLIYGQPETCISEWSSISLQNQSGTMALRPS